MLQCWNQLAYIGFGRFHVPEWSYYDIMFSSLPSASTVCNQTYLFYSFCLCTMYHIKSTAFIYTTWDCVLCLMIPCQLSQLSVGLILLISGSGACVNHSCLLPSTSPSWITRARRLLSYKLHTKSFTCSRSCLRSHRAFAVRLLGGWCWFSCLTWSWTWTANNENERSQPPAWWYLFIAWSVVLCCLCNYSCCW